MIAPTDFGGFVRAAAASGTLVVQPRMGFSDPVAMRSGLFATRFADATTVGTVTLDSYTRVGDHAAARSALDAGVGLNGYPIVAHGPAVTRSVLDGVRDAWFPVQVRHGAACPQEIVAVLIAAGLDATEGGPVSYCLPYSRTPLGEAVRAWVEACEPLVALHDTGAVPHVETFGGCLLGQLCPPGMLVAISVLEGLFFAQQGLRSVSLSYAQQISPAQDEEAVRALRQLAAELLPDVDWHVVVYVYMGVFPRTPIGARRLLVQAVELAVRSGAARLIVKTVAEAHRIPTVEENVDALELAASAAAAVAADPSPARPDDGTVYAEARALVEAVLHHDEVVARALPIAFARGWLDIPYCLHPDNAGRVSSFIDETGRLQWSSTGALPIRRPQRVGGGRAMTSAGLIAALSHMERLHDRS